MILQFRVYDKRLKLIRTPKYIDFEGNKILYDITDEAPSEIVRDFNEVEIMQSTGLKDSKRGFLDKLIKPKNNRQSILNDDNDRYIITYK